MIKNRFATKRNLNKWKTNRMINDATKCWNENIRSLAKMNEHSTDILNCLLFVPVLPEALRQSQVWREKQPELLRRHGWRSLLPFPVHAGRFRHPQRSYPWPWQSRPEIPHRRSWECQIRLFLPRDEGRSGPDLIRSGKRLHSPGQPKEDRNDDQNNDMKKPVKTPRIRSINRPIKQSIDLTMNQSIKRMINQSIDQSVDGSIDRTKAQFINRSNKPVYWYLERSSCYKWTGLLGERLLQFQKLNFRRTTRWYL